MELYEAVALAIAAFVASAINAVAGGGTLIAFPVLLGVGFSSKVANVTNTVAIWPGTVGGSWAYRGELSRQRKTIIAIALPTVVGAIAGAALLLATPESTFDWVVPFLILGACAMLLFQDRLTAMIFRRGHNIDSGFGRIVLQVGVFFVAMYGGYFGAAMGIVMLALFGLLLPEDIQHANALKGLVAMTVNGLAAVYFGFFGDVAWSAAAIMALAALVGGYLGVGLARKLRRERLRIFAVSYGTIAALILLARNF